MSAAVKSTGQPNKGTKAMDDLREPFLQRLAAARDTGQLHGLTIEYWKHGGVPPPLHRSEQLLIAPRAGRDSMIFRNETFDDKRVPPNVYETWTTVAAPEEIRHLARLILAGRLYDNTGEKLPPVADILIHEIILEVEGKELKKTYPVDFPPELHYLSRYLQDLVARAKRDAPKTLFHEGKRIQ